MRRPRLRAALTGLASGALLTAPLLGVFFLGALAGLASVPFTVFEWLIRVLPGRLVIFGLDTTIWVLQGLGLNIKDTAKATEQVLAIAGLFVGGVVIGLLFFVLVRAADRQLIRRYGLLVGGALGAFSLAVTLVQSRPATVLGIVVIAIWIMGLFLLWGAGLARLYVLAFPSGTKAPRPGAAAADAATAARVEFAQPASPVAEARVISRRRFMIEMGGVAATIVVVGAGLGAVLRSQVVPTPQVVNAPIPFPNAASPVKPVPGTRPEYTAVADHYRVDINLSSPSVDAATWHLPVDGQVSNPLLLTLEQLTTGFTPQQLFITLSCISNPVGGPLIGTTLWTGIPFRDVIAQARPLASARYAHITAADGFDEAVEIAAIQADPRIMLVYAWNGQPLPKEHGYPLRIYLPDLHGMKQPKWITGINLVPDLIRGYWVARGWDATARMHTTSVIDTVATGSLVTRDGRTYVPIGGIAHAGARGVSKVEVQVDDGAWEAAELRQPLSELTWVLWRYDWPFSEGIHRFAVRATDGQGKPQETQDNPTFPSGATGIFEKTAQIVPIP